MSTLRIVRPTREERARAAACELTPREREILARMAAGESNRAIGTALWLSPKTVESHVRSIFIKLRLFDDGAEHRRVAAVLAYFDTVAA